MIVRRLSASTLRVTVPAKLNLFLEVAGKRSDGYHELVTVMHPIALADELVCSRSTDVRARGDLEALGEKNLAVRAIRAAQELARAPRRRGMTVELKKRIPIGAGLGGGSADAAAAIAAYQRLYGLGWTEREEREAAARVGSDVAFFAGPGGRTALCTGRGEIVQPVRVGRRPMHFLLVYPRFESSTAEAYRRLKLSLTPRRADVNKLLAPLAEGDVRAIGRALFNRLEGPVFESHPSLRAVKRALARTGFFSGVLMSGSGSTIFGLCESAARAQVAARHLEFESGARVIVTRSF